MRHLINAEVMQHTLKFQQMGATVQVIGSNLCYVTFDIGGFRLQYVYNVNSKGNYFLERIKPYPLPIKEFESEDDVVSIIELDVEQFRSALKSHHIDAFIEVSRSLNRALHKFEDLYLYYNIPGKGLYALLDQLHHFEEEIDTLKDQSERLFFKKEPENL